MCKNKKERGFTIIEVLVALFIFSFAAVAVAGGFSSHLAWNTRSEIRTGAIIAVNQVLDEIRVSDVNSLPTSGTSLVRTVNIGPSKFDVYVTYCSNPTYCSSSSVRSIRADAKLGNESRYAVETVFSQLR